MALTDVVSEGGLSLIAARGNVGTVADAVASSMMVSLRLTAPAAGDVRYGVAYGQNGTDSVGTYGDTGGGSGSVAATLKLGNGDPFPDGVTVTAIHVASGFPVGSGVTSGGAVAFSVTTAQAIVLVAHTGLGGETVCTTPFLPS